MSTSRRSLFAIIAGFGAAIAATRVKADALSIDSTGPGTSPLIRQPDPCHRHYMPLRGTIVGVDFSSMLDGGSLTLISDGETLVEINSDEGQAILKERAVNLRADGTIRHRQHHWPRQ